MRHHFSLTLCVLGSVIARAATIHVGSGQTYSTLSQAAAAANPGDTILFHAGIYSGGEFFSDLQGTPGNPITIMPVAGDTVIHRGGNTGWHLSDAAYLNICNLIFEQHAANGFNLDDGGTYDSPSHNILFESCTFRDMNASGNNDLLKLSGLDSFTIRNCAFLNGAAGGSGIDMVGCHHGVIEHCHFENMGSNGIQAKGGTQFIRIEGNFFNNCGARSVNLGGSTGLQFFRPIDALFEAADLQVYSNIFIGSEAPIAYVGSERVDVINNTICLPDKWVLRILQETVDTTRFVKCGNNSFRNNIIYRSNSLSTDCNIGPNTDPQSFHFSNNLWYNFEDQNWSGPNLPVADSNNIIGSDPLFNDAGNEDFSIPSNSPATGSGYNVPEPQYDFGGNLFASPRSIGAFEGDPVPSRMEMIEAPKNSIRIYPNPFHGCAVITEINDDNELHITLFDSCGKTILAETIYSSSMQWCPQIRLKGAYRYILQSAGGVIGTGSVMMF